MTASRMIERSSAICSSLVTSPPVGLERGRESYCFLVPCASTNNARSELP